MYPGKSVLTHKQTHTQTAETDKRFCLQSVMRERERKRGAVDLFTCLCLADNARKMVCKKAVRSGLV